MILAVIIVVAIVLSRTVFKDFTNSLFYKPSPEMSVVRDKLELTSQAGIIFNASYPVLENRDVFSMHCRNDDQDVSILGCYTDDKIYVFEVDEDELDGIVESTSAHEFLHAVWDRMSSSEREQIEPLLNHVYNEHKAELSETIESYTESDRLDELHARIGTQIANLPTELEEHYARFFNDQDNIVKYYDNYSAPFKKLKAELESLEAELTRIYDQITADTKTYETRIAELNTRIEKFNNCANTPGCFTKSAFNSQRSALIAEQNQLETLYNTIDANVMLYNQHVEEYNENLLHSNNLQNAINSNKAVPNI